MLKGNIVQKAVILAIYSVLPFIFRHIYYLRLLNILLIFTSFVIAANIIFGHTRQLFLCQGALIGIGAYISVIMTKTLTINPWMSMIVGAIMAAGIGATLSFISSIRRLSTIFLAVLTSSFQIIFIQLILGMRGITGAEEGITIRYELLGEIFGYTREFYYYYLLLSILFTFIVVYDAVINSSIGIAWRCIIEDEAASSSIGINVVKYKVIAATLGSLLFGFMGGMYAYYTGFIAPAMIEHIDTTILVMLIFGGMGTLIGPLLGSAVFTVIYEILRPLGPLTTLIFGIILIILFLYFRDGLAPWLRKHLLQKPHLASDNKVS